MKKIYLALLALTLGVSAQAQRNLKLDITIVKPIIDTNIKTGSTTYPVYVISNVGTSAADSIGAGDTIWLKTPANVKTGSGSLSGIIPGKGIKIGESFTISNATITGGYSVPFANMETLTDATGTYMSKPFTNNTQYWWFVVLDTVIGKTTNPPIATVNYDYDTQRIWINKATSIFESEMDGVAFKTYPNPAVNQLSFDYNFEGSNTATATILDINGRVVMTKDIENASGNKTVDLNITSVSSGMYFLRLDVGEKSSTVKFSVQK